MTNLGLDIGGANIKAADGAGRALSRPFPIWRAPERLSDELTQVYQSFPETKHLAVTMTAELADCFGTKREGVQFILNAVATSWEGFNQDRVGKVFNRTAPEWVSENRPISVWSTSDRFVTCEKAVANPMSVAAANWHGLATWCGRLVPKGNSLLIDIGTTTTDIIPLIDGYPSSTGLTDLGRLISGELSYSGIRRTPLCSIAQSVPFREGQCPLAAEVFATSLDLGLLLEQIEPCETDIDTANGKPATIDCAHDRLARQLCCDREELTLDEAVGIARFLADVQFRRLAGALRRVVHRLPGPCDTVIISGSGSFLGRRLIEEDRHTRQAQAISLDQALSPTVAEAACAHALAQLLNN